MFGNKSKESSTDCEQNIWEQVRTWHWTGMAEGNASERDTIIQLFSLVINGEAFVCLP